MHTGTVQHRVLARYWWLICPVNLRTCRHFAILLREVITFHPCLSFCSGAPHVPNRYFTSKFDSLFALEVRCDKDMAAQHRVQM
jgi:hypothetical protein